MESNEIILNVSGKEYILQRNTYKKLPTGILEKSCNISSTITSQTNKVYLERHSESFESILWYFTHGQLHMPLNVCPAIFASELKFWKIEPTELSKCCYLKYISYFEDQKLLNSFTSEDNTDSIDEYQKGGKGSQWEKIKLKGRNILEHPTSSLAAKVYVAISVFVILTSVFVVCASTHPSFQRDLKLTEIKTYYYDNKIIVKRINNLIRSKRNISEGRFNMVYNDDNQTWTKCKSTRTSTIGSEMGATNVPTSIIGSEMGATNVPTGINLEINSSSADGYQMTNTSNIINTTINAGGKVVNKSCNFVPYPSNTHVRLKYLDYIDICTTVYFTLELLLRFLFCSKKSKFFLYFLNIVDTIALFSEYLMLLLDVLYPKQKYNDISPLDVIQFIQILRVFRVFRILKYSINFRIVVYSLKESINNMCIMTFLLFISILVFASIVYYSDRTTFNSIPDAMWWAVITMTTVGYGDVYPGGIVGKIVGSVCAVSGVFVLALLIPVLVNNFILFIGFSKIHGNSCRIETKEKDATECSIPLMEL